MRMYNLEGKGVKQLKDLEIVVMTHPDLTLDEKEANLKAIRFTLYPSSSKALEAFEEGKADVEIPDD